MKTYKAYIFDLDGTLLDSMSVWDQIDIDFLGKRGIAVPPDYIDSISSMTFRETAAYTIRRFALSDNVDGLIQEWNDMATYAYGNTVRLKPYAKEYLLTLYGRGVKLAVATSLFPGLCDSVLRANGIDNLFNVICNTDEAGQGKSQSGVFLLAAKKTGVSVEGCLVFEDILSAINIILNNILCLAFVLLGIWLNRII